VLPEVESRITFPGISSPLSIPRRIMLRAARSFTEPPGLKPSSFAKMRTAGAMMPSVSLVISSSGVFPIKSRTFAARWSGTNSGSVSARDRGDD
jgi:hypothetical protein